jgi:hypothetical protein
MLTIVAAEDFASSIYDINEFKQHTKQKNFVVSQSGLQMFDKCRLKCRVKQKKLFAHC